MDANNLQKELFGSDSENEVRAHRCRAALALACSRRHVLATVAQDETPSAPVVRAAGPPADGGTVLARLGKLLVEKKIKLEEVRQRWSQTASSRDGVLSRHEFETDMNRLGFEATVRAPPFAARLARALCTLISSTRRQPHLPATLASGRRARRSLQAALPYGKHRRQQTSCRPT